MTDVQVGTVLRGFVIASKKNTGIIVRLVHFFIYKLISIYSQFEFECFLNVGCYFVDWVAMLSDGCNTHACQNTSLKTLTRFYILAK